MKSYWLSGIAGIMLLVGCGQLATPLAHSMEDMGLNPGDVRIGEVLYACGRWSKGEPPPTERVIVDVYFARGTQEEQETAILERNGTIIYRYHMAIIRAELPTGEIPGLAGGRIGGGLVDHARSVPSLERTDFTVLIRYDRPVEQAHLDRIAELGGRVRHAYLMSPSLLVEIPDRSVPVLRSEEGVVVFARDGVVCLD
jgi:hypothetical protein